MSRIFDSRSHSQSRLRAAAMVLSLCAALSACDSQETVTHYKPFFAGVEGAKFGQTGPTNTARGRISPTDTPVDFQTVIEHDDGTKTYISRCPAHVMAHVEALLDEDTDEADQALVEQLIDATTKEHYRTQGKDPLDYVKLLRSERKNIAKFFARMPMAENSPTVVVQQPGNGVWKIELTGQATRGTKFTQLWVRQDAGQWRLQWIK